MENHRPGGCPQRFLFSNFQAHQRVQRLSSLNWTNLEIKSTIECFFGKLLDHQMYRNRRIFQSFFDKIQVNGKVLCPKAYGKIRPLGNWEIMCCNQWKRYHGWFKQSFCSKFGLCFLNKAFRGISSRVLSRRGTFLLPQKSQKNELGWSPLLFHLDSVRNSVSSQQKNHLSRYKTRKHNDWRGR